MLIISPDLYAKIDEAYSSIKQSPSEIAPHEYVLIYSAMDDDVVTESFLKKQINKIFPDVHFSIKAMISPIDEQPKIALIHPKAYLMLQYLITLGASGEFDLEHMARFGFSPTIERPLDLLRFLKKLRQVLDCPTWNAPFQQIDGV